MSRSNAPRNPIEDVVRYAVAIGATLVLVLPAARADSVVGWLPLWLLGLPLCAWACLRLAVRLEAGDVAGTSAPAHRGPAVVRRLPATQPAYRRRRVPAARRRAAHAA